MAKSNTLKRARKSPRKLSAKTTQKPYPGFPLTPHPSGRWCKTKVFVGAAGKKEKRYFYYGKLDNPYAALEEFNRRWPYEKDGRTPPDIDTGGGCTVRKLCNEFLHSKLAKVDSGELSRLSFHDYHNTCAILVDQFGLDRRVDDIQSDDFGALRKRLAKTRGLVALKNEINRCRIVFTYAFDERLVDAPVRYGQSFDMPSAKSLRVARNQAGPKMFNVEELTQILAALDGKSVAVEGASEPVEFTAEPAIKAMVLLGLNCGFGNTDVATLPQGALKLEQGWVDFPRPKTGIHRRVPLWPETVAALKVAIARRPVPKDLADGKLVFLNRRGRAWVRVQATRKKNSGEESSGITRVDMLSQSFRELLDKLGINSHRNFYTLRHNFETWAGESKDQVAVDAIMGHVDPSMGAQYREHISDERLRAVVNVVRAWVFPKSKRKVR